MEKKIVFSCSCFIDQSVWFVNSIAHSWKFDSFTCVEGSVSNDLFIYKKDFTFVSNGNGSVQYINEIIVCCVECSEFLLTYFSTKEEIYDVFNEIDCLYVIDDQFCYNSEIYIGNDQFMTSNANLNYEEREELYHETKKKLNKFFKKQPERKSCFTSIQKYSYEFLCTNCKRIFDTFFLANYILLKNELFIWKYFFCLVNY